jgi:hypothetical protein
VTPAPGECRHVRCIAFLPYVFGLIDPARLHPTCWLCGQALPEDGECDAAA